MNIETKIKNFNHPNFKGGKINFNCEYCGKIILRYKSEIKNKKHIFCTKKCYGKWSSINKNGINAYNYKGGKPKCIDCGKLLGHYNAIRCKSCAHKRELNYWFGKKKSHIWIKKISGKNNINWLGGISFEPYTIEFNKELKSKIRKRDNYICQLCGILEAKLVLKFKKKLSVHHIDYNKMNIELTNLISLCQKCHMKTNGNRDYYYAYFMYIMEKI